MNEAKAAVAGAAAMVAEMERLKVGSPPVVLATRENLGHSLRPESTGSEFRPCSWEVQ